ncbi:hypothetical protein SAMN02745134_00941 [Clostridium acidisoli DSM 12555]|uniref:Uncharacterized protein n=1 Tax=Clostridium acidisoli DSM 12555 TaxID=1121291 RepID=A0A1W1X8G8_9CLOT|nr:hypothetical protein [Clostridium acidisoli]SMC19791.1 hypothetical protein SAMN02745134_00941 [Clostridium acidisoli DSM 12555]
MNCIVKIRNNSKYQLKYGIMINSTNVLLERGNIVYDKELVKDRVATINFGSDKIVYS